MPTPRMLPLRFLCVILLAPLVRADVSPPSPPKVDFGYAFGFPHRLTVALPDSSDKTLVDCEPGQVTLSWTYGNLLTLPLASFTTPRTEWRVVLRPEVDGQKFPASTWHRAEGWLPVLASEFTSPAVRGRMEIVGGAHAAMVRMEFTNTDAASHRVGLDCTVPGHWKGVNLAFVDPAQNARLRDTLIAGWNDRTDRVIITGLGGEDYPVAANTVYPAVVLRPGETKTLWVIRPYRAYQSMLPELRARDWPREFAAGKEVWRQLIGRATQLKLPDAGVRDAYYAGLADFFIMREPVARDYLGIIPGTEVYRASNPTEGAIVSVALVQAGLPVEAAEGYRMSLDQQGFDGCWADPEGWGWGCWFCSGLKSWFIIEHYLNTRDRGFLADVFPRMLASSRWQERQRARSRHLDAAGARPLNYGLLPRGMGDAGLKDDDSLYGVFIPDNIWAVYGDEQTLRAAEILGLAPEIAEARAIYATARADLIDTIRRGAITENGYQWIPGVAGKTSGSRWGALNAAFPTRILPPDDALITGTIRKMESKLSPGGIPMHTGWMEDGMWVAITLDNLAETLLLRGDGDGFSKYLYATLNHGTPLYSWCEERAPEPGAAKITGDRQHLWTPLAVVRAVRDALVFEDGDVLHLARGADRSWLPRGPVGGENFSTHFGAVAYQLATDPTQSALRGEVTLTAGREPAVLRIHVRLPSGRTVKSVDDPAARIVDHGEAVEWTKPPTHLRFTAELR